MPMAEIPRLEIESLAEFDSHIANVSSIAGWTIQSVDLTGRAADLRRVQVAGALFLGCELAAGVENDLRARGALVFSMLPRTLPFNAYRGELYRATELYDAILTGHTYGETRDATIYAWFQKASHPPQIRPSLAMSLHDHAITNALDGFLDGYAPEDTVGVMGGHQMLRGSDAYTGAARLGSRLAEGGKLVVTGGGPGAMEAANLGARFAGQFSLITSLLQRLATAPSYTPDTTTWAGLALEITQSERPSAKTLGIPTWFYGHEPPNAFATFSAKYFSNALREHALLTLCRGGLVYLPGAAGTVQEIFQAATRNYYAADESLLSPMILVDSVHWTDKLPAWQLLKALGAGRAMADRIHIARDIDEAAQMLLG